MKNVDLYGRVATVLNRRPSGLLAWDNLQEIARENDASVLAEAVLTTLKGPEAELPTPHHFHDIKWHRGSTLSLKWWQSGAMTWRDVALSVHDTETLPTAPIEGEVASRA